MRVPMRNVMFGSLLVALMMEAIGIAFLNSVEPYSEGYHDIGSSLSHFSSLSEDPNDLEARRRVIFLSGSVTDYNDSNRHFYSRIGRQLVVDDKNPLDTNFSYYETQHVDVLRNPVTMDGRDGGDGVCEPAADWQTKFYPTCNSFHELDMRFRNTKRRLDGTVTKLFGVGTSRDAWRVKMQTSRSHNNAKSRNSKIDGIILKTLQMSRDFSPLSYHFQVLDAIASERLSSSPYAIDIYGFCGFSVLNEPGEQLDLEESQTRIDRLRYARDLAAALADAHRGSPKSSFKQSDGGETAKLVHADLRHSNVLTAFDERRTLKLSDFNQGYFLGWNKDDKHSCGYLPNFTFWNDRFAAPEECMGRVQTEKTDVYHLGGMIFYFLTGYKPYTFNVNDFHNKEQVWNTKQKWKVPILPKRLEEAVHPANVVMKKTMELCMKFNANRRPTAREVFHMLNETYAEVEDWEE